MAIFPNPLNPIEISVINDTYVNSIANSSYICATPQGKLVACPQAAPSSGAPVCGNNIGQSGEQCDDGNTMYGDGCSQTCTIETTGTDYCTNVAGVQTLSYATSMNYLNDSGLAVSAPNGACYNGGTTYDTAYCSDGITVMSITTCDVLYDAETGLLTYSLNCTTSGTGGC